MIGFSETNNTLHIEGVSFETIARDVGTPAYVYSSANITSQFENLQNAMKTALPDNRQPLLCYAAKANSNLAILTHLRRLGSGLEIVSEGELIRGLKAGFSPAHIVATGVGKQKHEIAAHLNAGIHQLNVESLPELEHINIVAGETGKVADVVFRLNPDVANAAFSAKTSTGGKCDKFGIDRDSVFKAFSMAKDMEYVNARGLSVHIGSQVSDVETFKTAFEKMPALVTELRAEGFTIERLDIGGGFPIIYKDEQLLDLSAYASWVNDIIAPLETEIIMEPGRYLVGNAGMLLTEVLYVKETEDRTFLVVDAAMNDLIRPTLYEAYHGVEPVNNRNASNKTYDVVGPICEAGDVFATGRDIPEMNIGDLAVIKSAGAYGFCMASNYNTRPLPAEVMVDGDHYSVIRKRQTLEEIIGQDIIPDWLSD